MTSSERPILPEGDILNDFQYGKFVLSNLAAKRARQLKEGAPPLVRIDSIHPLTIAFAEIAAGKIKAVLGKDEPELAVVESEIPTSLDETLPSELGMLLPALDESDADLIGVGSLLGGDLEAEEDHHEPGEVPLLADLLDDTEAEAEPETEPLGVAPEEGTVSLDDLAEEEQAEDDDQTPDD